NGRLGLPSSQPSTQNQLTLNGIVSGSGSLTKDGVGMLVLTNTSNSYSGNTIVNGGTLSVSDGAALGPGAGSLSLNNGAVFQATGSYISSRAVILGGTGGAVGLGGGSLDVTSGVTETRTGVISGAGTLVKTGNGTLALTTAVNSYTGGTVINGGTLQIDSNASMGATSGTATINNGTLEALSTIATGRNFLLGSSNSTILTGSGGVTYTINGTVADGAATGTLNKNGAGTLTLSNANSYSGSTIVNGGVLLVTNTNGSATGSGAVTI